MGHDEVESGELTEALRSLMAEAKVKGTGLAKKAGLSDDAVNRWLRTKRFNLDAFRQAELVLEKLLDRKILLSSEYRLNLASQQKAKRVVIDPGRMELRKIAVAETEKGNFARAARLFEEGLSLISATDDAKTVRGVYDDGG